MKSLINSILLPLAVAISLTLGGCAERQPGTAQDHLSPDPTPQEKTQTTQTTETTDNQPETQPENPKQPENNTDNSGAASTSNANKADKDALGDTATEQADAPKDNKIDTHSEESSKVQSSINDLKDEVKQLKDTSSSNYLYVIITFIIAIVGLATAIVNYVTIRDHQKSLGRHRDEINQLKSTIKFNKQEQHQQVEANRSGVSQVNTELLQLRQRIVVLENQLSANPRAPQQSVSSTPAPKQPSQHAFFPAPAVIGQYLYFPKMSNLREMAFFEAEVTGSKAIFWPCVNYQNITSSDAVRNAIEFEGVSKSEAKGMTVITNGQAECKDGKWYVTRRVTIRLTK